MQKTGTNEEVDQHVETMTELVQLWDAQEEDKENKSACEKARIELEEKGAQELWDAAMMGRVHCQALVDVTQVEGSTLREKKAQQNEKQKCSHPSSPGPTDTSNLQPAAKRQQKSLTIIENTIQAHQETTTECLQHAQETDAQCHHELMDGLTQVAEGIRGLTDVMHQHIEHEDVHHAAEAEE